MYSYKVSRYEPLVSDLVNELYLHVEVEYHPIEIDSRGYICPDNSMLFKQFLYTVQSELQN